MREPGMWFSAKQCPKCDASFVCEKRDCAYIYTDNFRDFSPCVPPYVLRLAKTGSDRVNNSRTDYYIMQQARERKFMLWYILQIWSSTLPCLCISVACHVLCEMNLQSSLYITISYWHNYSFIQLSLKDGAFDTHFIFAGKKLFFPLLLRHVKRILHLRVCNWYVHARLCFGYVNLYDM